MSRSAAHGVLDTYTYVMYLNNHTNLGIIVARQKRGSICTENSMYSVLVVNLIIFRNNNTDNRTSNICPAADQDIYANNGLLKKQNGWVMN